MGLMQRVLAVVAKALPNVSFGGPGANNYKSSLMWSRGLYEASSTVVTEPYRTCSTVGLAIDGFTSDAASVQWEVYPKGGDEPIDPQSHPVLDLWRRPNPRMYGRGLFKQSYLSWWLHGETIWYLDNLSLGRVNGLSATARNRGSLLLLEPTVCIAKVNDQGKEQWYVKVSNVETPLDMDRLVLIRNPNPYNPLRGLSPIDSIIMECEADYAASRWNRDTFGERNGIPSGMLIPPADANVLPEDRDYYTRLWNQSYGSGRRSVGILPSGWDFRDASLTHRDMEFRQLREYTREQILARIGYPPFFAGVLDKANYANAREQRDLYWNTKISGFLVQFQDCLNYDFLPRVGATDIEVYPAWEFIRAQTENFGEKVTIAKDLQAMGFTRRQINARLELGFDVDENDDPDIAYMPFSLTPVDSILNPPEPAPTDTTATKGYRNRGSLAGSTEARRATVWRSIAFRARDLEPRMNSAVRKHFKAIEAEVLGNIESIKGWLAERKAMDTGALMFDSAKAKRQLQAATKPIQTAAIKRGGDAIYAEVPALSKAFTVTSPAVIARLAQLSGMITRITDTVEMQLRATLVEGVAAGESASDLAGRVSTIMDASLGRSMTIARTETAFAYSSGRDLGMREAGINRQEWLSARDDAVRDDHAAEDGSVVFLGEAFPTTGLRFPCEPGGPPEQVINCRCVAIPVVEDIDE